MVGYCSRCYMWQFAEAFGLALEVLIGMCLLMLSSQTSMLMVSYWMTGMV